jgi:UDP-glucuronate 4-epimerase
MRSSVAGEKLVLVTGAAGFIGYHLCARLLSEGVGVVGLDSMNDYYDVSLKEARLKQLKASDGFNYVRGDISNSELLSSVFTEYSPRVVVHLAAQAGVRYSLSNPSAYITSNIIGFHNILECCRKSISNGRRLDHLVYASSSSVYGANKKVPYSVEDKTDKPVSLYAATKKSNELSAYAYSHLFGIPATGLRFFTVYGPWGRPDMAYFGFTERMVSGLPIQLFNNGNMYRDFTYIDDIVDGVVAVVNRPPVADSDGVRHKVYNIGNNHPVRLDEFVDILEATLCRHGLIASRVEREYKPMQAGEVYQTFADVDELARDFGIKPVTALPDGLDSFVQWYKAFKYAGG